MRRADRLFDIIQLLRRNELVRARDLAEALEVSERTIYRDIAALIASGVPIEGEAGLGYVLRGGFDLPPLMFDEDEIEALAFGAQIVASWADRGLASAGLRALAKIEAILPDKLREHMCRLSVAAPCDHWAEPISVDLEAVRLAVREQRKMRLRYRSKDGVATERVVRPLLLSFYGAIWNLTCWCELRDDFRTFRLDLVQDAEFLDQCFICEDGKRLADLMARAEEHLGRMPSGTSLPCVGR